MIRPTHTAIATAAMVQQARADAAWVNDRLTQVTTADDAREAVQNAALSDLAAEDQAAAARFVADVRWLTYTNDPEARDLRIRVCGGALETDPVLRHGMEFPYAFGAQDAVGNRQLIDARTGQGAVAAPRNAVLGKRAVLSWAAGSPGVMRWTLTVDGVVRSAGDLLHAGGGNTVLGVHPSWINDTGGSEVIDYAASTVSGAGTNTGSVTFALLAAKPVLLHANWIAQRRPGVCVFAGGLDTYVGAITLCLRVATDNGLVARSLSFDCHALAVSPEVI